MEIKFTALDLSHSICKFAELPKNKADPSYGPPPQPYDWHFPHTHMTIDAMSCPICCISAGNLKEGEEKERERELEWGPD